MDDLSLYAKGQMWLNQRHIMGRASGYGIVLKYEIIIWLSMS